ncbi:efflux RND transporter periplasmic adaptor subunit [Thiorhodovibrio frisius]|uniref:RND family efflux transporter, MFP subunit n=1 Tax=Thiorhodovibrio frisius TaxID=631362 RepID=H8Z219_9GAMM|nr:efflux RND transporter periplasmic adaptor subunit [Thiorhodovibrio frisius]EIC21544.1 RND family efflux transporter, MFP subunit [Thiorhodovibrio frisius]WPL24127.1 Efflux pump periplasmic linker BepF [Thiorhodovibrio frisius]
MRQAAWATDFSNITPVATLRCFHQSSSLRWRLLPAAVLAGLVLGGCSKSAPPAPPPAPPSVVAEPAKKELVEGSANFVGRVVAINKVELRARVEGFLKERRFTEGDRVDKDQVLFLIEPDQYQAVVEQRQADVASAEASELNASAQLKRGQELLQSKNIAQSKVDELQAAESVAQASIQQAKAALNSAELNLGYTQITAPVAGRIGLANYTIGNLVAPSSGPLATLVSQDPIYVQFPVTQRELLEARREIEGRGGNAKDVKVKVELPDGSQYDHTGQLDFVDVTTNETTDSVTLRAELANPKGILIDGQFVNLSLALGDPDEAVVVPQAALQVDQQGVYIFVVDEDSKAQVRRIETGPTKGADVAVTKGLKEGELVIVEGIQKVRPGQPVKASPPQEPGDSGDGGADQDAGAGASTDESKDTPKDAPKDSPKDAPKPGATVDDSDKASSDKAADDKPGTQTQAASPGSADSADGTKNQADQADQGDAGDQNGQAEQEQNSEANAL